MDTLGGCDENLWKHKYLLLEENFCRLVEINDSLKKYIIEELDINRQLLDINRQLLEEKNMIEARNKKLLEKSYELCNIYVNN